MPISELGWRALPVAALLLAGCGQGQTSARQAVPSGKTSIAQTIPAAEEAPKLPCARDGARLQPVCTLTRERSGNAEIWTIGFPDGGFRRLLVEGNEVSAADGAEPLRSDGDDVVIGRERYRLPDD